MKHTATTSFNLAPSALAMVPFVSVENMMRIVNTLGPANAMQQMSQYIESDFARWDQFDKTPRVAAHSREGVIELMPTSDGETYGFKYVNGHPANMARGFQTVTAFGVLARVRQRLSHPVVRDDRAHRPAHGGNFGGGRQISRAATIADHGDDRQWCPVRVSGPRLSADTRHQHRAAF